MIARRLLTSLVLAALIGNVSVFAVSSAGLGSASGGQAFTLVSLRHETVGAVTRIQVESSAPPLYTVFRPTDRLVVVDLPGCEGSRLDAEYAIRSALVDSISVKESAAAGGARRAATRLEVSVKPDARDRSSVSGNILTLEIAPDTQASAAAGPQDAKRVSEKSESSSPGVYVYPAPVAGGKQPTTVKNAAQPTGDSTPAKPLALKPATLVRDVRSEGSPNGLRVVVEADGSLQYKDFILPDPWRIVVDITGVRNALGNRVTQVNSGVVDRIRVGQPAGNVVRIVLDAKSKVNYQVERDGQQLIITVGNPGTSTNSKPATDLKPQPNSPSERALGKPEVKVAGERIENKSDSSAKPSTDSKAPTDNKSDSNLIAQASRGSQGNRPPQVGPAPNPNLPLPTPQPQPVTRPSSTVNSTPGGTGGVRSTMDVQRPSNAVAATPDARNKGQLAFCDPTYVGGLISFDLRAGVDIRDMLRFISQQYGVNFIIDRSVSQVPVDIRVTDIPWNHVMDSVLKANRLGAVCESNGRMIRIATLSAISEEEKARAEIQKAQYESVPLVTKIIHLKYARAAGYLAASSSSSGRGSSGGGVTGGQGGTGGLMAIVRTRLSPRGRVETDVRTNSVIITDLPEYTEVIEDMIAKLDKPESQVEIEARIVIANRNFLRDIGVELASAVSGSRGQAGVFETSPARFVGGNLLPGGPNAAGGAAGGAGGAAGGAAGSTDTKSLGPNLVGPFPSGSLTAGVANSVLSLTTGAIGTAILSSALSLNETKGQVRTIASPRITTTDNKTAEIVNGVQIPVQTVSNNTITTTFVTAALRLEITPQIIEEAGQVLMHVVAENNTVNFTLANQFNNGTPGINTQSAESTVLVSDGGTTVMGGINIDTEGHTINRVPGVSKLPVVGELFKHRAIRRDADEILFFLTPRIIRQDGLGGPGPMQRSSVEGTPNPASKTPQRAAAQQAPQNTPTTAKVQPAPVPNGKPNGQK